MTAISAERIAQIMARRDELQAAMSSPDLAADQFVKLSKEYAEIEPVAVAAAQVRRLRAERKVLEEMRGDAEMRDMAEEELRDIDRRIPEAERARRHRLNGVPLSSALHDELAGVARRLGLVPLTSSGETGEIGEN